MPIMDDCPECPDSASERCPMRITNRLLHQTAPRARTDSSVSGVREAKEMYSLVLLRAYVETTICPRTARLRSNVDDLEQLLADMRPDQAAAFRTAMCPHCQPLDETERDGIGATLAFIDPPLSAWT
jgi:hypothetical protein